MIECHNSKRRKQYYFLAAGSLLILALMLSSLGSSILSADKLEEHEPAVWAGPSLQVIVRAEDYPANSKTGVIVLGLSPTVAGWPFAVKTGSNDMTTYTILITYNGVSIAPDWIMCAVVEKDKVNPVTDKQGPWEQLKTSLTDRSEDFVCKHRQIMPGVGVLDVYFIGSTSDPHNVADYMVVVTAGKRIGRTTIWGSDIQDLCILGWSMSDYWFWVTLPDGTKYYGWTNAFGPFYSSKEAVFLQRLYLGLPILST